MKKYLFFALLVLLVSVGYASVPLLAGAKTIPGAIPIANQSPASKPAPASDTSGCDASNYCWYIYPQTDCGYNQTGPIYIPCKLPAGGPSSGSCYESMDCSAAQKYVLSIYPSINFVSYNIVDTSCTNEMGKYDRGYAASGYCDICPNGGFSGELNGKPACESYWSNPSPDKKDDADGDGLSEIQGDCNDNDSTVYPGATEICDNIDNDCNINTSEDFDGDGDGVSTCDGDCNDSDPAVTLDCSACAGGQRKKVFYIDKDRDSYGDITTKTLACNAPSGFTAKPGDCDDASQSTHPGALEVCDDKKDNDCNRQVDELDTCDNDGDGVINKCDKAPDNSCDTIDQVSTNCYYDNDLDKHSDCSITSSMSTADPTQCAIVQICAQSGGSSDACAEILTGEGTGEYTDILGCGDCNDNDSAAYDPEDCEAHYCEDKDGDGDGDPAGEIEIDYRNPIPAGHVKDCTDCNDYDATINPSAVDICGDGIDSNCDKKSEEMQSYCRDADGDKHGDPATSQEHRECDGDIPLGYVASCDDCNDKDASIYPGAPETCTSDKNCDGKKEPELLYYPDADGDGHGDNTSGSGVFQCEPSEERPVKEADDCNDQDPSIYPGAKEVCDGKDNDCNYKIDDNIPDSQQKNYYRDKDGDSYGLASGTYGGDMEIACAPPPGYVGQSGDCDDENAKVYPGAAETCDGLDNNCNGTIDDGMSQKMYYEDRDEDKYGNPNVTMSACAPSPGYVADNTDCDDVNEKTHPGATETCDNKDNNCNGTADEGLTQTMWYIDKDRDYYGSNDQTQMACAQPDSIHIDDETWYKWADNNKDCNDNDNTISPDLSEKCGDHVDNNCDGKIDEAGCQ